MNQSLTWEDFLTFAVVIFVIVCCAITWTFIPERPEPISAEGYIAAEVYCKANGGDHLETGVRKGYLIRNLNCVRSDGNVVDIPAKIYRK